MTAMAATARPATSTATPAFVGVVLLGGLNAVAVRVSIGELGPLWSAALRFGIAAAVLLATIALTRRPVPHGRALTGSILYGLLGFAGAFGCIHWALLAVPPAATQTILALVPLLTFMLAVGIGLERFRASSAVGGLVAFAGVAVIFGGRLGTATPLPSLLAAVAGAAFMAAGNVVVKRLPGGDPIASNAVAMTAGAAVLLAASVLAGERQAMPRDPATWAAVAYVSLAGSVAVFTLFVHVVRRRTASSASYVMLLMPLVTVTVTSAMGREAVTPSFILGGALVLVGVYAGAIRRHAAVSPAGPPGPHPAPATQPGCA